MSKQDQPRIKCDRCNRTFATADALHNHSVVKHDAPRQNSRSAIARQFAADHDDMPDGAFFAMADEWGIQPEDFA